MIPMKKEGKIIQLKPSKTAQYDVEEEKEQNILGKRISEARKKAGLDIGSFRDLLEGYGVSIAASSLYTYRGGRGGFGWSANRWQSRAGSLCR